MIADEERLRELDRFDVLDSAPEANFDRFAALAAQICAAPLAFINFVAGDRQFSKSIHGDWGLPATIPLELSACALTVTHRNLLVIEDATRDPRLAQHPAVVGPLAIRFYAGAPLVASGHILGTVCVLDRRARALTEPQAHGLTLIAEQVMDLLEARRELIELRGAESLRAEAVEALLAAKTDLERRIELRTRDVEEAHARTRHILERVRDGFVALDRTWHYIYVNERAGELLGRAPSSLVGKHIWTEFPEGVGQPFHLAYERALRDQVTITFEEHYGPWNRWFENRIYPSPDGISIFFTDITERKVAQAELEASRARLLETQRMAHVGSWEWDAVANRVSWSEELYRIYGITKDQFVGSYEGFLERVHADDLEHTKSVIGAAYQNPGPFAYDHRIVRPDGSLRMLHTRGESVAGPDGRTKALIGSCWDTTEKWETEEELRQTRVRLEEVSARLRAALGDSDER